MQIKRRPAAIALAVAYGLWTVVIQPLWNLNLERLAEKQKLDTTLANGSGLMEWLTWFVGYVPSSFGLGFVTGALIFAYWDLIASTFNRHILRRTVEIAAPEIKAWVGSISVTIKEKEPGMAHIFLEVLNWGEVPFKLSKLRGNIVMSHGNSNGVRVKTALLQPAIGRPEDWERLVEPGFILMVDMAQPLPATITRYMPDLFAWPTRPYFEFGDFEVWVQSPEGLSKRLKLSDSVRLTAGDWAIRTDKTTTIFNTPEEAEKFRILLAAGEALKKLGGRD